MESIQQTADGISPPKAMPNGKDAALFSRGTKRIVFEFLRLFLPYSILIFILFVAFERLFLEIEHQQMEQELTTVNQLAKNSLVRDLEILSSDIRILRNSDALRAYVNDPNPQTKGQLQSTFWQFGMDREMYDQIRYIDHIGQERVRVNIDGGFARIVPDTQLQDKSDRYYVQRALSMPSGAIYVSRLDLNIENGQIEQPHVPTIRIALPVHNREMELAGVLALNYNAGSLLERYTAAVPQADQQNHLLNTNGFWFNAPPGYREWGFMFGSQSSFATEYPDAWQRVQESDQGSFYGTPGYVSFLTVYPAQYIQNRSANGEQSDRFWKIVSIVPAENLTWWSDINNRFNDIAIVLAILLSGALGCYYLAKSRVAELFAHEVMRTAKREAEQANRAKSDFLATMSHELRTPLNAVLGFAQMMHYDPSNPLSATQTSYLKNIEDGGHHLLTLVNDILDLSRIETDQLPINIENATANALVQECITLIKPMADKREVSIKDHFSTARPVLIRTDPVRFKQALMNVLSNAVKFNKPGGKVLVNATITDDGFLKILVNDTGIGIPEHERERAFLMFNRLDADPMIAREGIGIGLSVTKMLMERMGGHIDFESIEGNGSTFWLSVPLSNNDDVVIWETSMRTGIDPLDRDHQIFARLINKLAHSDIPPREIDIAIEELRTFAREHFEREEIVMRACNYQDLEQHARSHETAYREIADLANTWRLNRNQPSARNMHAYVRNVWIEDIMGFDADLAEAAQDCEYDIHLALRTHKGPVDLTKRPDTARDHDQPSAEEARRWQ